MAEKVEDVIDNIKMLEQSIMDKKDAATLKKLGTAFSTLQKLKDGPLAYLDVTTTEEIIHLYDVDMEEQFEELQKKDTDLRGGANPNNYAWMPADIHLIVIDRTEQNEAIAKQIISQIISSLKETK